MTTYILLYPFIPVRTLTLFQRDNTAEKFKLKVILLVKFWSDLTSILMRLHVHWQDRGQMLLFFFNPNLCFISSSSSILYPWGSLGHHRWFCNRFPPFFSVLHCPLGLGELQACHSLMLFSHLFLCLPCLLPPFTVPCKMVLAGPDERESYHCSLNLYHGQVFVWSNCLLDLGKLVSELVSWCFEPSQPQRITSGLKKNFN